MAKKPSSVAKPAAADSEILSYRHPARRKNNPEVGMVTPATDADDSKAVWQHDPHLDPSLQKEGMARPIQMMYFDLPYGIKYGSNFQPLVNKRDVKDRAEADLTQEPEMIKAFRDTWELGIHSYLSYLRDRLLLAKELLNESGSVSVQIGDENVHLVRNLLDEIFGVENFVALVLDGHANEWIRWRSLLRCADTADGKGRIATWSLDTDYDERSLFPHQVFFPMAGKGEGWDKLKKDIRAELDEDLLPQFHGTVSLPFVAGDNHKVAVKIVDDRGIESLKIVNLED